MVVVARLDTVKYESFTTLLQFAAAGFSSDPDRLQVECDLFAEHIDYVEDVCKLISHVAVREADRVRAKHSQVRGELRLVKLSNMSSNDTQSQS